MRALYGLKETSPGPTPDRAAVEAPEGLSAAARAVWDRLAGDLVDKGVLDAWSRDAFARLCWLTATSEALRAELDAQGFVVSGARHKEPVKSKLWTLLRQVDAELVQLESRFGLLPADRSRVAVDRRERSGGPLDPARLLS